MRTQRPAPIVIDDAAGAWVTDIDGNRYIDYALGDGPLILWHSPQPVLDAIRAELDRGLRIARPGHHRTYEARPSPSWTPACMPKL